jgi:hypothetical protein
MEKTMMDSKQKIQNSQLLAFWTREQVPDDFHISARFTDLSKQMRTYLWSCPPMFPRRSSCKIWEAKTRLCSRRPQLIFFYEPSLNNGNSFVCKTKQFILFKDTQVAFKSMRKSKGMISVKVNPVLSKQNNTNNSKYWLHLMRKEVLKRNKKLLRW